MLKKPNVAESRVTDLLFLGPETEVALAFRRFQDLKNVNTCLVLFLHEEAERHPKGSDEWLDALEIAHQLYLEGRRKRRGRTKKEGAPDDDAPALWHMHWISQKTGEKRARKLAQAVVKLGSVPNFGDKESQVERLARKYTKRRDTQEWHGPNVRLCEPDDPEFADDI
jgi:hypothetical protein